MRGQKAEVGATRVSANGYKYTKVKRDGKEQWILTHWLIWEKTNGRRKREDERIVFANGNKKDFRVSNIVARERGTGSARRRIAQIEDRIRELTAERDELLDELRGMPLVRRNKYQEEIEELAETSL